jgi:hypothetical protein
MKNLQNLICRFFYGLMKKNALKHYKSINSKEFSVLE